MEKLEERGAKREEREKTVIQGAAVMYAERVESTSNTQQNENEAESHGQFDGRAGGDDQNLYRREDAVD